MFHAFEGRRRWRWLGMAGATSVIVAIVMCSLIWVQYGYGAYWLARGGGQWAIGIYEGDSIMQLTPMEGVRNPVLSASDITDVTALFVADPFMMKTPQGWVMFFEVYDMRTDQGDIALATSKDGRQWKYEEVVLDEPFHLSYPCVFEWEGQHYMVPESYQAGAVRLYRAAAFPRQWKLVGELIQGKHSDPTLFRHDGRWWMFTESNAPKGNDTLSLFYAENLTGPWVEHPQSPVVRGNRDIARPGGRVLEADGRLLRFAQDCDPLYGNQLRAFEILELTPTSYREQPVADEPVLGPSGHGWNKDGMHQLDPHPRPGGGWIASVDGQRVVNWIGLHR